MRTLLIASLLVAVALLGVGTVSADQYNVGNCQKSGACASVCIHDADTACWNEGDVCLTFSYEVPFCLYPQK